MQLDTNYLFTKHLFIMSTKTYEEIVNEIFYNASKNENNEAFEHIYLTRHLVSLVSKYSKSTEENVKNILFLIAKDSPNTHIDTDALTLVLTDRVKAKSHVFSQNALNFCEHKYYGYKGLNKSTYNHYQYSYARKTEVIIYLIKQILDYYVNKDVLDQINDLRKMNENNISQEALNDYIPILA